MERVNDVFDDFGDAPAVLEVVADGICETGVDLDAGPIGGLLEESEQLRPITETLRFSWKQA